MRKFELGRMQFVYRDLKVLFLMSHCVSPLIYLYFHIRIYCSCDLPSFCDNNYMVDAYLVSNSSAHSLLIEISALFDSFPLKYVHIQIRAKNIKMSYPLSMRYVGSEPRKKVGPEISHSLITKEFPA